MDLLISVRRSAISLDSKQQTNRNPRSQSGKLTEHGNCHETARDKEFLHGQRMEQAVPRRDETTLRKQFQRIHERIKQKDVQRKVEGGNRPIMAQLQHERNQQPSFQRILREIRKRDDQNTKRMDQQQQKHSPT